MEKPRRAAFPCRLHSAKWKYLLPPILSFSFFLSLLHLSQVTDTGPRNCRIPALRDRFIYTLSKTSALIPPRRVPLLWFLLIERTLSNDFLSRRRERKIYIGKRDEFTTRLVFGNWISSFGLKDRQRREGIFRRKVFLLRRGFGEERKRVTEI